MIGIFWDDLIARRATGRKLTELLLDKVDLVIHLTRTTYNRSTNLQNPPSSHPS
jgi:hypothetical protein